MQFTKFEPVALRTKSDFNEKWIQDRIAEDPAILGLGDVVVKDKERQQPRAGRLDLLLQDVETLRRFEVEIQLGATDESHIIRTIEYWDIERRRYPNYEHTAVIVAEDITSRFLNVINLFNGMIPLIAIQMKAFRVDNKVGLVFTRVVDQLALGLSGEDEEVQETTDRAFWEQKTSKKTLAIADELLDLARRHNRSLELKYNKFYIGLAKDGQASNFVIFRPKKNFIQFEPRLKNLSEMQDQLSATDIDLMPYDVRWGRLRIRLQPGDVEKHKKILDELTERAFLESVR